MFYIGLLVGVIFGGISAVFLHCMVILSNSK